MLWWCSLFIFERIWWQMNETNVSQGDKRRGLDPCRASLYSQRRREGGKKKWRWWNCWGSQARGEDCSEQGGRGGRRRRGGGLLGLSRRRRRWSSWTGRRGRRRNSERSAEPIQGGNLPPVSGPPHCWRTLQPARAWAGWQLLSIGEALCRSPGRSSSAASPAALLHPLPERIKIKLNCDFRALLRSCNCTEKEWYSNIYLLIGEVARVNFVVVNVRFPLERKHYPMTFL